MQKRLGAVVLVAVILVLGVGEVIAISPPRPVSAAASDWHGEFFANPSLQGSPVHSKDYSTLDLDWGDHAPFDDVPADYFSARFTRTDTFKSGVYLFGVRADDGSRVYIDGQLIVDTWMGGVPNWQIASRTMTAGEHTLVVEYNEQTSAAFIEIEYYPFDQPGPFWRAEYYPNTTLADNPAVVGYVDVLTLDWGFAPPIPGWNPDGWSIRFYKNADFSAETYVFAVRSDDGAHMYLDGQLIVDAWNATDFDWHEGSFKPKAGTHVVTVDFYDATGAAQIQAGYYPSDGKDDLSNLITQVPTPTNTPRPSSSGSSATARPTSTPRPTATATPTLPYVAGTPLSTTVTAVVSTGPVDLENGIRISVTDAKRFVWKGFPGLVLAQNDQDTYYYVKNRLDMEAAVGRWYFEPHNQGYYDVFVYIPSTSAPATAFATYFVTYSHRLSQPIIVDQNRSKGQWVGLGNYYFGSFSGQYIQLDNLTGEESNSGQVLYGDALFVYTP